MNLELDVWRTLVMPVQCVGTVKRGPVAGIGKALLPQHSSEMLLNSYLEKGRIGHQSVDWGPIVPCADVTCFYYLLCIHLWMC